MAWSAEFELRGAGGEPVDLPRTFLSHGVASLPPFFLDDERFVLEATLRAGGPATTVVVRPGGPGMARVEGRGERPAPPRGAALLAAVRHVLRMDDDLSPFYALVASDPDLAWAARGAGRMMRSETVFEDVVKTICTTNCAWSATERMVDALVVHLGEPAGDAPADGTQGRAFPTPAAMAAAGNDFYRDVVRAGYRGRYLTELAGAAASGAVDLEALAEPGSVVDDDEAATRLLALPGVGPYAAAHVMMLLGRYSRLVLDSWSRPKYARLAGRKAVKDSTIERRFRRYRRYRGLAFWLFVTRDWVEDEGAVGVPPDGAPSPEQAADSGADSAPALERPPAVHGS